MTISQAHKKATGISIEEGVKKAMIEGGYEGYKMIGNTFVQNNPEIQSLKEILLDPKYWSALGKVEGWDNKNNCGSCNLFLPGGVKEHLYHQHKFIDALNEEV